MVQITEGTNQGDTGLGERFRAESAKGHWADEPTLAAAAEAAGMTEKQAECWLAAAHVPLPYKRKPAYRHVAQNVGLDFHIAQNVVERAWTALKRHLGLSERQRRYYREMVGAQRNRKRGGSPHTPLTGILPYRTDQYWGKPLAARDGEPVVQRKDAQEVSLRGAVLTAEDLPDAVSSNDSLFCLVVLAEYLRDHASAAVRHSA